MTEYQLSPEAELPRLIDEAESDQTYTAGYTPTKIGDWATELALKTSLNI